MKYRFILTVLIIIIFAVSPRLTMNSFAAVFINFYGSYASLGDEGEASGGGLALIVDRFMIRYFDNISFSVSSSFLAGKTGNSTPYETGRFFIPVTAGIIYSNPVYVVPVNFYFSSMLGGAYIQKYGPSYYGSFVDPSDTSVNKSFGPHAELKIGFNYIVSQKFSFFIDGGYQWTYMKADFIAEDLSGIQINSGIRYTISGLSRSFFDD